MQAKEALLEQLGETYGFVSELVEKRIAYLKLEVVETSAHVISGVITAAILAITGLLALVFALIAAGFGLSQWLGSYVFGFGAIALLLFLIFVGILFLRVKMITVPVNRKVITQFFENPAEEQA